MKFRKILKIVMLGAMMFSINASIANAALITGSMGVTGNYSATGGTDLSDATILNLNSVTGTSGTGDIGSSVGFGTPGTINNGSFSFAPFVPEANIFEIGGWQLDLTTLTIVDQTASLLTLEGTGVLSGVGYDNTGVNWTFSGQSASSYSMTITAVPVPAAAWLFGSGLLGLVSVVRRKTT